MRSLVHAAFAALLCCAASAPASAQQASANPVWPAAQDSALKDAIVFLQRAPLQAAPENDPFQSGPSDSGIRGRLFYLGRLGVDTKSLTVRHFNVTQSDRPAAPLWTVEGGVNLSNRGQGGFPQLAFWSDGHGIDMTLGQGGFPGPPYPYMGSLRYDFDKGRVWQTPPISKPPSVRDAMLDGPHAWSRDHRLLAYWYPKAPETRDEPPLAALAIGSTRAEDNLTALPVEPSPQQANAVWTNRDTLLYDYSERLFATRNSWHSDYEAEGFDRSRDFTNILTRDRKIALTPPHWWPAIYEVDPLPFRTLKSAKARVLIPNAFAPIPSPDGRFIAFCGWGRDTPVPMPKKGEKPEAEASQPRWWVWDRTTKKRTLIGLKPIFIEQAKWTPDSHALIFIPQSQVRTQGNLDITGKPTPGGHAYLEGEQEVPVIRMEVTSLIERRAALEAAMSELGRIRVRAVQLLESNDIYYYTVLRMRGLTHDGKFVLADVRDWENRPHPKVAGETYPVYIDTIHALRLSDKSDQTAAKLEQAQAYDWFDMSQPAP